MRCNALGCSRTGDRIKGLQLNHEALNLPVTVLKSIGGVTFLVMLRLRSRFVSLPLNAFWLTNCHNGLFLKNNQLKIK